MNVRLSQKKNRFKKFCPDFAYNRSTPATNEGCTGFLLQRQLNPAELIRKLALVDGLQGPEIIGVYPKLYCHQTQSMEKAWQPLCDCTVAITKAFCMFASKYFRVYHGYYNKRTPATLLYFVPREVVLKQQEHRTEQCAPGAGLQDLLSRARMTGEKVPKAMLFGRQ